MDKLCEFLKERNIKTVIMESTGPYSTTVYYFLESRGFDVWMAHPRDNKPRSQKKTDISMLKDLQGFCVRRHPDVQAAIGFKDEKIYEIALSAIRLSPRLRAFYDMLIERGKAKKQALIAVARKIAVGVWHILTRKVRWNKQIEKRLFRPRRRRVSKFTVREAIALLRNAGYIVIKSRSSI